MKHEEFKIGKEFYNGPYRYRCTDTGTRTIAAICLDEVDVASSGGSLDRTLSYEEALKEGWFNGPPYAILESIFDEEDMKSCSLTKET